MWRIVYYRSANHVDDQLRRSVSEIGWRTCRVQKFSQNTYRSTNDDDDDPYNVSSKCELDSVCVCESETIVRSTE